MLPRIFQYAAVIFQYAAVIIPVCNRHIQRELLCSFNSAVRRGVRDCSENVLLTSLRGKKDCSGEPDPAGGTPSCLPRLIYSENNFD
ncbi:hypothetical protein EZS27_012157 [termite gut metagenome]|uniref:Uncharacterized protein n=1 Tax=termite gut metagenome TaxID=433724 RepID=A0A5J4S354_9ZZZZ